MTFVILTMAACSGGSERNYDAISLVLGKTAQPHAERIVTEFLAIWPLDVEVRVYEQDWTTFDETNLVQIDNTVTAYIGNLTDEMANGPSDYCNKCDLGFTGLALGPVSLNGISHRGSLERLAALLAHELGHSAAGLPHTCAPSFMRGNPDDCDDYTTEYVQKTPLRIMRHQMETMKNAFNRYTQGVAPTGENARSVGRGIRTARRGVVVQKRWDSGGCAVSAEHQH